MASSTWFARFKEANGSDWRQVICVTPKSIGASCNRDTFQVLYFQRALIEMSHENEVREEASHHRNVSSQILFDKTLSSTFAALEIVWNERDIEVT